MNGKIKTKFAALFAVALMITVCVVPMVGNDYGEAETVTVPSDAETITINGKALDAQGKNNITTYLVIVSDGENEYNVYSNGSSYNYTLYIPKDAVVDEITVTLNVEDEKFIGADGQEKINGAYGLWSSNPELKFTDVKAGSVLSNVNFVAGHVAITGQLEYANGGLYAGEQQVALYEHYKTGSGSSAEDVYDATAYSATAVDGKYALYVPANLEVENEGAKFVVGAAISDVVYSGEFTIGVTNLTGKNVKSVDTYALTIKPVSPLIDETVGLSVSENSPVELETTSVDIVKGNVEPISIEFTVESGNNNDWDVLLKGEYGTAEVNVESDKEVDYVQTAYVTGTVKMGAVFAIEGTVTLTLLDDKDETVGTFTAEVEKDGSYRVWYTADLEGVDSAKIAYKSGDFEVKDVVVSGFSYLIAKNNMNLAVASDGYHKIEIKVNGLVNDTSVSVSIEGAEIFGLKGDSLDVKNTGAIMAPKGSMLTITPNDEYGYDVGSKEIQVIGDRTGVNAIVFNMETKDVKLNFVDYNNEPLSGVAVYLATYDEDDEKWTVDSNPVKKDSNTILSNDDGEWCWTVPGNLNLEETFVVFDKEGRHFASDKDVTSLMPVSIDSIDEAVKVIDTYNAIQILDADGESIEGLVISVGKYSAYVANDVVVYNFKSTEITELDYENGMYSFIGIIGDQKITLTPNDVLAINMMGVNGTEEYIFNEMYPLATEGTTVIKSYRNTVTGTVYESDMKTVITSIPGTVVNLMVGTNNVGDGKVAKDGTFTINTYTENISGAKVVIADTPDYSFDEQPAFMDDVAVTSYYAKEMSFAVTFTDADGKVIKYTNGKIKTVPGDTSGDISVDSNGVAVFQIPTDKKVGASLNANDGTARSFQTIRITDEMISSKKIDFVSGQATYTVKLTDSKGDTWKSDETLQLIKVTDTVDSNIATLSYDDVKKKATAVLDVPVVGSSYVVKSTNANYFGMTEYAFTDYVATVPAIGSFVEVTAVEANGTVVKTPLFDNVSVYEKGKTTSALDIDDDTTVNVVKYFAIDGKEYEFKVTGETPYSFGNKDVNGGKISAVDGLLLANEETVSGKVTFANGYNDFTGYTVAVTATYKENEGSVAGAPDADLDGQYKIIVDVDKVEKYKATINAVSKSSTSVAGGSSSTPEIVLDESYITGSAPSDDVEAAVYKDGAFVKSLDVQVNDGKYVLIVDASDGDEIVMTITASGKTFQQAIDLKAVQNDIIVPGSLVSDKTNALFADFYVIYGADTAVIGSKIVLSAKNAVSIQMDVANVAYTTLVFDGWYVNGEKVSDDVNATYTVNGPCEVYAYYTEKVTETGAVADSSNDLSMDVLILGIVIVVLALLAFVYAVKFKKE